MAEYIVQADLARKISTEQLAQLTNDQGTNEIDSAVVDGAIAAACRLIDAKAGVVYQLPLQSTEIIKQLAIDITSYNLYSRRQRIPASIKEEYERALALLDDVANGDATLVQPSAPQTGFAGVKETEVEERFSDTNLEGYA